MIMRVAAAWLLSSIATNQASAWQQWQNSHHNNFNTNRMDYGGPSFMYLDNYDPSGHENSSGDGRGRGKPKIDKANKTKKIQTNLSFHNYPRHIAPHVDKSQDINEKKRRRRSRLASRSTASAILPTKQRRTKQCTESNLLTFEEETEIAYSIQAYATAMRIKDDLCTWMSKERNSRISGLNKVPSEEHWASACSLTVAELHDVIQRGQEARAKLVAGNVGLVTVIAKKYYHLIKGGAVNGYNPNNTGGTYGVGGTLKLDDLIQEGYIGIMDAAERFDPERGFRFSTYGSYWVRQRILRSISESSRIIRLPEHVQTMLRNIHRKRKEFEELSGRSPSLPELAHELSISLEKVTLYQHLSHNVMSLEHQLNKHSTKDEKQMTVGDKIPCSEIPTPDEDAMSEAFRGEVHSMLDHLGDNERWVLTHRFGLEDGYPRTLREISEEMCVSVDMVKSIETKALNKLRQPRMMYRLKDFVDGSEEGWDANGYNHNGYTHNGHSYNGMMSNDRMNHNALNHNGAEAGPPIEGHEYIAQQHPMIDMGYMNQQLYSNGVRINDDNLDDYEMPTPESIWSF